MYKLLLPLLALAVLLSACSSPEPVKNPTPLPTSSSSTNTMQPAVPSRYTGALLSGMHTATLKTSKGNIEVQLDADRAPKTVTNFIVHAQQGYYDNLTFHRVIKGFMIQGGDPEGTGRGGESIFGPRFEDEIVEPMRYEPGTVAMANAGPNTNGSQFFIMHEATALPPDYTIFGHVTKGQDIVDAIAGVATDGPPFNRPLEKLTFSVIDAK